MGSLVISTELISKALYELFNTHFFRSLPSVQIICLQNGGFGAVTLKVPDESELASLTLDGIYLEVNNFWPEDTEAQIGQGTVYMGHLLMVNSMLVLR